MTHDTISATIRAATAADAAAIADIYNFYISNTIVTFEEEAVSSFEVSQRMAEVQAASLPWLVAEVEDQVVGFGYASKWKGRSAYRFCVEVTAYLHHTYAGFGVGTALYEQLFPMLEARGMHAAVACIALPNGPSVALHQKFGLKKAAHFEEVGFKFGRWIDVGYWQTKLESSNVIAPPE